MRCVLLFFSVWCLTPTLAFSACGDTVATQAPALSFSLDEMKTHLKRIGPRSLETRLAALERLETAIRVHEEEVIAALTADLGKPRFEGLAAEVAFIYEEIRVARKHLAEWMRPVKVGTPLVNYPARSMLYRDPLGVVLILSAWNYPFQLLMGPLVAALAGGNSVVVKPSEVSPATAAIIEKILREAFSPEYVTVQQGGPDVSARLTSLPFNHIFFTGSSEVGKKILAAAAPNLTPVTLELGGKSPVIVHHTANLDLAAERIVWGCNLGAGQTCVRPDYIIVDSRVKDALIEKMREASRRFYGDDPSQSPHFARIVNHRHFDRLVALLKDGKVVIGGTFDREKRFIAPTFLTDIVPDSRLLTQEIFGPITPILEFNGTVEQAAEIVDRNSHPLALYCFTRDQGFGKKIICELPFGGGALNDVVMQISNPNLPFGGVGQSGMGKYHGRWGFELFTNAKPVLEDHGSIFGFLLRPLTGFRFPPYTSFKEWLFRLIGG